jgi:TolB-like protein/DNA-binding winged helix-turn-helix (wHTH) protein
MDTLASSDIFLFEGFRLDRRAGGLFRCGHGEDTPIEIGSRALDILGVLVARAGEIVSKDEISAAVWPRRVVEDSNLTVQISALRRVLDQGRSQGSCIQTVSGRGYRFVGICISKDAFRQVRGKVEAEFADHGEQSLKNIARPLRVYSVGSSPTAKQPITPPVALLLPDKPSLAVLPFENLTGHAEQDYFVDGMVEEITTAIARLPWLFVIARNSAFTYKGRPVDVKQVAQELGVRYVLEGSVRKAGNRVRITGQLIDTTTSAHIWADRFDGALDDIFELQDQVASSVAGAIEPKLRKSEIERAGRKPTANLTAYDLYLRALAQSYRYTEEGLAEAVVLARQALAIDPSYAPAAAMVGWCRGLQRVQGWGALSANDVAEACRLARQALEAERDDAETIWQAAETLFFLAGEAAMAAAALDRALALNPNAAHAWLIRGHIHALRNQPEAAIEAIERARRLSPFDPYTFLCAFNIAVAHLTARRFELAIEWADRALHDQPRLVSAMRAKVAALAHLGHLDAARAELSRVLAIYPQTDHRRLSRVRSLCVTGSSRTLRHRPAPGRPAGEVSRR